MIITAINSLNSRVDTLLEEREIPASIRHVVVFGPGESLYLFGEEVNYETTDEELIAIIERATENELSGRIGGFDVRQPVTQKDYDKYGLDINKEEDRRDFRIVQDRKNDERRYRFATEKLSSLMENKDKINTFVFYNSARPSVGFDDHDLAVLTKQHIEEYKSLIPFKEYEESMNEIRTKRAEIETRLSKKKIFATCAADCEKILKSRENRLKRFYVFHNQVTKEV